MATNDTIDMATLGALPPNDPRRTRPGKDMAPAEMTILRRLFSKFLGEEAAEPAHKPSSDARTKAAGVIVRAPAGDCLFMKRSTAGDHAGTWAFPAGKLEGNESPVAAARRELKEETGHDAPRLYSLPRDVKLKVAGDSRVDFSTFLHHSKDAFKPTLNNEHTEYKWAKPDQAPEPLHPGVKALLSNDKIKKVLAYDPPVSEAQRRAMYAAREGRSTLGIPRKVGEEFVGKDANAGIPIGKWADDCGGAWKATDGGQWKNQIAAQDRQFDPDAILAFDRAVDMQIDQDGRLHIARMPISKAAVNPYLGKEIPKFKELGLDPKKVYRLWRHPDELKKAANTFNLNQLLIKHEPVDSDDYQPDLIVGSLGTNAEFDAPYLYNSGVVWAQPAIDRIRDRSQKELSASYHYDCDMTPGITPEGLPYDGIMRNIRGNHSALVKEGRAGPDVAIPEGVPAGMDGRWR